MLLLKTKISVLFLIVSLGQLNAQTIVVKDTVFANELCEDFPLAMDATCKLLDTIAARANYSTSPIEFRSFNMGITDVSELKYFSGVDSIFFNKNKLTSFMPLSTFPNLNRVHLPENLLTEAPAINYVGNEKLTFVYLQDNKIASLPTWEQPNPNLLAISIRNNELTSIPDFNGYNKLNILYVDGNHLNFNQLLVIKNHPRYSASRWRIFPQKPFFVLKDVVITERGNLFIDIPNIGGDKYYLYKNESVIDSTTTNQFQLSAIKKEQEGIYKIRAINNLFSDENHYLESKPFSVTVNKFPEIYKEKGLLLFSPNGDGLGDQLFIDGEGRCTIYDASGKEIIIGQLPYIWDGRTNSGDKAAPGMYYIKTDTGFLKALLSF